MFLQLTTGISNYVMHVVSRRLREYSAEPAGVFVVAEGSVGDEGIATVATRETDNWFRTQY